MTKEDAGDGDQERLLPTPAVTDMEEDSTLRAPKPNLWTPAGAALGVSVLINVGLIATVVSVMCFSSRARDLQLGVWYTLYPIGTPLFPQDIEAGD